MKLAEQDIIAILLDRRPEAVVAEKFGVAQNTINRIRTGARWPNVAPHIPRWRRYIDADTVADVLRAKTVLSVTGCLEWTAARISTGYGAFSFRGVFMLAHRAAYESSIGPIPDGMVVRHRCDNPRCCNPEHLQLGTDQDNKDDCVSKKRHYFGERHHWAKLTESQVHEIRASESRNKDIAIKFGIDPSAVSLIKRNINWRAAL